MSEQQFLWNSLDGGENLFIKERGSDKIIHIKIIEGKHEFVEFMEKVNVQQAEIERLKEQLSLVCKAESSSSYNSVKEVLRRQIFGLDCVAQESANAWNHYCVLNKLFEEQYGEYWDNFD